MALAAVSVLLAGGLARAGLVSTVTVASPQTATLDATIGAGEYSGSFTAGGNGFGGPIGSSTLNVTNDGSKIYFGLTNLGDYSNNSIRIYIDSKAGGYSELSNAAGFNDFGDFGRERLSRPAKNGLVLPFAADYGWIFSPAFGGFQALFQLQPGGNNSLVFQPGGSSTPVGEYPTKSTVEFSVDFTSLGINPGDKFDMVLVYANNNDASSAYMSNEGIPFQFSGGNPGEGPVTMSDYVRVQTAVDSGTDGSIAAGDPGGWADASASIKGRTFTRCRVNARQRDSRRGVGRGGVARGDGLL
jgi:hypothetical protein